MPKKTRGRPRVEYLIRSIEVRSVRVFMSAHVEDAKSTNLRHAGKAWMQVRGVFDEPVKKQTEVVISIHEETDKDFGTPRPAVIGHVIDMRPACRIVMGIPT